MRILRELPGAIRTSTPPPLLYGKKVVLIAAHLASLVHDSETNELDPKVERALSYITDSFDGTNTDLLCRSNSHAAINSLPLVEWRVVEVFLADFPIDLQGTDAMTMVKMLGCSETPCVSSRQTCRCRRDESGKLQARETYQHLRCFQ